jgi:L-glyceraldehyde 3-phosphate reductase
VDIVRQGKALYVGISNWPLEPLREAVTYLRERDVPLLIYQGRLNMLHRQPIEEGILDFCKQENIGFIAYSPLAQGLLTDRYLDGIPADSRMAKDHFLHPWARTEKLLRYLHELQAQGQAHGRTIAQEALNWILEQGVTSVLVGASSVEQLSNNISTYLK